MSEPSWQVSGEYFETCNCDYLCPCIFTNLTGPHTHSECNFAMVYHIERGTYGATDLDGLNFAVIGHAPGPSMSDGNIDVGVITDDRATPEQQQALVQIGSGQGGGPMAALGPLVRTFLGTEARPIQFELQKLHRSVVIPGVLEQAIEGVPSAIREDEPLYIDNSAHPANARLALAKATHSHLHVFGLDWDETSGANNGHFAPFDWRNS